MYFNILDYYKVDRIGYFRSLKGELYFTIELVSKSTGEILDITLDEESFDNVLLELEVNLAYKKGRLSKLWKIFI